MSFFPSPQRLQKQLRVEGLWLIVPRPRKYVPWLWPQGTPSHQGHGPGVEGVLPPFCRWTHGSSRRPLAAPPPSLQQEAQNLCLLSALTLEEPPSPCCGDGPASVQSLQVGWLLSRVLLLRPNHCFLFCKAGWWERLCLGLCSFPALPGA